MDQVKKDKEAAQQKQITVHWVAMLKRQRDL